MDNEITEIDMNTFGRKFRVSIFGESHGELIGAVLDGVPAGIELSAEDFVLDLGRRKSGAKGTTPRIEEDRPELVSGVYDGYTTGAPLTIVFRNMNTKSSDYGQFAAMPRPGHADLTAALKWDDFQDPRGSGHFSGRLTLPVVAAGVVAKKMLADLTILDDAPVREVSARIVELGTRLTELQRLIVVNILNGKLITTISETNVEIKSGLIIVDIYIITTKKIFWLNVKNVARNFI